MLPKFDGIYKYITILRSLPCILHVPIDKYDAIIPIRLPIKSERRHASTVRLWDECRYGRLFGLNANLLILVRLAPPSKLDVARYTSAVGRPHSLGTLYIPI